MRVDIQCKPSYALAYCYLEVGEAMRAESGAMVAMSDGISVGADAGPGGAVKGLFRKTLGGESFFMARYTANVFGAWVAVAPRFPGDITQVEIMPNSPLVVEAGATLAISEGLSEDVKFAGFGNVLLREGVTMQRISGRGTVLIGTYGGMQHFSLGEGEGMVVDTGHLVGYTESMKVKVGPLSGLATSVLSGEGLVARLSGPGEVFIQSRAEQQLQDWLFPERAQNAKERRKDRND